jgi:hypothetical protein
MWFTRRKLNRLKKAKIDGSITPAEEIELLRMLEGKESERTELMLLAEIENQLQQTGFTEEQINIQDNVMREIAAKKRVINSSKSDPVFFENYFINPIPMRFAVILLAGILIGSVSSYMIFSDNTGTNSTMLTGSLSATPEQGMSFSKENITINMIPYQIGTMHYLNFISNTRNEVQMEVAFNDSDFTLKKSEYITSGGSMLTNMNTGSIVFTVNGQTSFQIILEKMQDQQATVTINGSQNQSVLFRKEFFID